MVLHAMEQAHVEDADLVREALEGNQLSFQLLVERYQGRLFGLARHYTRNTVEVEDIVQDAFLKAFSRLETFQHQSSFYTWLYRIATNTILDFMKRRGRNPVTTVEDPDITVGEAPECNATRPDARLEEREIEEDYRRKERDIALEEYGVVYAEVLDYVRSVYAIGGYGEKLIWKLLPEAERRRLRRKARQEREARAEGRQRPARKRAAASDSTDLGRRGGPVNVA